jgi:hypothetical protein
MSAQIIQLGDYLDTEADKKLAQTNRVLNAPKVTQFSEADLADSEQAGEYILSRIREQGAYETAVGLGHLYEALIALSARVRTLRWLRDKARPPALALVVPFASHRRVAERVTKRLRRAYTCRACGSEGHNRATCQRAVQS